MEWLLLTEYLKYFFQLHNKDGEQQLSDYFDFYGLKTGYLLTFNFNESKEIGIKTVTFDDKTLIEAIV